MTTLSLKVFILLSYKQETHLRPSFIILDNEKTKKPQLSLYKRIASAHHCEAGLSIRDDDFAAFFPF